MNVTRSVALFALTVAAPAVAWGAAHLAVVINGAPAVFDQPPVERAGRTFVPLRGVFERLGASVVYRGGTISATSGSHAVSLQVGSTAATVDGTAQTLDDAPFVIAGRVLVPLRFVSQALGATVNFDEAAQTAYVSLAAPEPPPARIALRLIRVEPANGANVERKRPEISATFAEPVVSASVRLTLDDRDVTPLAYVSNRSFVYDPESDVPDGEHTVVVTGKTPDREPFEERWSFTSVQAADPNYINGLEPPNGTLVRNAFSLSAFTKPRARVRILATTSATLAAFSEVTQGSTLAAVTADKQGYFSARVEVAPPSSGIVDVRVASTAPDGSVALKTLRLRQ